MKFLFNKGSLKMFSSQRKSATAQASLLRPHRALQGRAALVTGASRGIGAAIARRLAADGAHVAITYAGNVEAAEAVVADIHAAGGRGLAIRADSADADAVRASVTQTFNAFGRLDILVNNAGSFPRITLDEATLEDFDAAIAINLRAAFIASQAAAVHMGDGGRIISVGSSLVARVGRPGIGLYVMCKAALEGLTKSMARDFGPRGITANIIHPGPTDTDMNPADSARADQARAAMALARYGSPPEVAALVAWLASHESQVVTGSSYTIDGGMNA